MAESLRTFYVALTRAQNRCYVCAGEIRVSRTHLSRTLWLCFPSAAQIGPSVFDLSSSLLPVGRGSARAGASRLASPERMNQHTNRCDFDWWHRWEDPTKSADQASLVPPSRDRK